MLDEECIQLLNDKINKLHKQQEKIECALKILASLETEGVSYMESYRLQKENKELHQEITKIRRFIHPEIIA